MVNYLLNGVNGRAASIHVMAKQGEKCPIKLKNNPNMENEIIQLAHKITNDFRQEDLQPTYNENREMLKPLRDSKYLFDMAFKSACNNKLNAFQFGSIPSIGWNKLSEEEKAKWQDGYKNLMDQFDEYSRGGGGK